MPAYWLARALINEPVAYKRYADQVPAILAKFGGKVLARGGKFQIMEGTERFKRFVVIEFPSFDDGVWPVLPQLNIKLPPTTAVKMAQVRLKL